MRSDDRNSCALLVRGSVDTGSFNSQEGRLEISRGALKYNSIHWAPWLWQRDKDFPALDACWVGIYESKFVFYEYDARDTRHLHCIHDARESIALACTCTCKLGISHQRNTSHRSNVPAFRM